MRWNTPNILTTLRMALIPLLIVAYYLPYHWTHIAAAGVFLAAAATDWLDGYLARKLKQLSSFGAFLDPVADKLVVVAALVLLAADGKIQDAVWEKHIFTTVIFIIIAREIAVSALREWMARAKETARVAVSMLGKLKTVAQMSAIALLLYREPIFGIPIFKVGETLLYLAATLTIASMFAYLKAAWPSLTRTEHEG